MRLSKIQELVDNSGEPRIYVRFNDSKQRITRMPPRVILQMRIVYGSAGLFRKLSTKDVCSCVSGRLGLYFSANQSPRYAFIIASNAYLIPGTLSQDELSCLQNKTDWAKAEPDELLIPVGELV
jgi:hypothetical protein